MLLAFPDSLAQARAVGERLGREVAAVAVHRFPDGESRLRLPPRLPERVAIVRSLDDPNGKLVELLLAAETARTLGARDLVLVAPYLCYLRQDMAFVPGEAVSQQVIGRFLAGLFDAVVTVDPHLHRVHALAEAVPARRAIALSAAPAMGAFLAGRKDRPLLLAPDREAEQWVARVAAGAGLEHGVADKLRRGDRRVEVSLPDRDYAGAQVVLVDDVASTGHTLAEATRALRGAGAYRVDVLVTHALLVDDARTLLADAGVTELWSSDSIPDASNAFPLADLLADALREDDAAAGRCT
ncbi:MAG: ribose-phosphate diphosphokinase [Pseudomonadales bacterium]|jgi:ribose-phosphate pyrophosphokinase|nr:ribose-phosphate diphosphokinase [Pseudomonadales bacterium]